MRLAIMHFSLKAVTFCLFLSYLLIFNASNIYAGKLAEEAESYRNQGYEAQERGDIDTAISWYQKSADIDPGYAAPHNDLGILFESKGWLDRAESEYKKALSIDPDYAKSHTNLALLYERKGELEKAAFHWMRRYKLGKPKDPWTEEARKRLVKLGLVGEKESVEEPQKETKREQQRKPVTSEGTKEEGKEEVIGWTRIGQEPSVTTEKKYVAPPQPKQDKQKEPEREIQGSLTASKQDRQKQDVWTRIGHKPPRETETRYASTPKPDKQKDIERQLQESLKLAEERLRREQSTGPIHRRDKGTDTGARNYYTKARDYFNQGEYSRALDTIRIAKKDYPEDSSLFQLEQSIKNKMKEERIEDHYNEGIIRYQKKDYTGARKEFEAILNILPE